MSAAVKASRGPPCTGVHKSAVNEWTAKGLQPFSTQGHYHTRFLLSEVLITTRPRAQHGGNYLQQLVRTRAPCPFRKSNTGHVETQALMFGCHFLTVAVYFSQYWFCHILQSALTAIEVCKTRNRRHFVEMAADLHLCFKAMMCKNEMSLGMFQPILHINAVIMWFNCIIILCLKSLIDLCVTVRDRAGQIFKQK